MEDLPVFLPLEQSVIHVELSGEDVVSGVYQIYDGLTPQDVINLTGSSLAENLSTNPVWLQPLHGGENFRITRKDQKTTIFQRGWMTASHRMTLAIPLHPDRMSKMDWKALPGIGDALAERIENDRQKNGDFSCLEALVRVKGIGKKRVNSWREFFDEV